MTKQSYRIFKDILPKSQIDNIANVTQSPDFGWFVGGTAKNKTVSEDVYQELKVNHDVFETTQLCHGIVSYMDGVTSHYKGLVDYMLEQFVNATGIQIERLLRVKLNLQLKVGEVQGKYNTPHTDFNFPHLVLIYYVNDSDAKTTIFKQKLGDDIQDLEQLVEVPSEAGTFVLFDGLHYHAGMHPKVSDNRIVMNICIQGTMPGIND